MKYSFSSMLFALMLIVSCHSDKDLKKVSPVNLDHALSLVDSMSVSGENLVFIHIYADAPDYHPVEAKGEGITCVDDVGRFLEVLETEICDYGNKELLPIALGMTRFLLYMSSENGLWNNFMFADGSINKSYKTSRAEFQWWAVRGLRGLVSSYAILEKYPVDDALKNAVIRQLHSMDSHLDKIRKKYPKKVETEWGLRPAWLIKNAPDINSELLLVLCNLHGRGDFLYLDVIQMIANGLIDYQYNNNGSELDGLYFSWQSLWHNWGNNQSTALLKAYQITGSEKYLDSVRRWADRFVPYVISSNYLWEIKISDNHLVSNVQFPQIAYGIHSIYSGMSLLADIDNSTKYYDRSEKIFSWFKGDNIAETAMYNPNTGRCYDGINSSKDVNLNSGAESTIECLLAIQKRAKF